MELFALFVLGFAVWGAYHLWYVPRETQKKSGSRPAEPRNTDKQ